MSEPREKMPWIPMNSGDQKKKWIIFRMAGDGLKEFEDIAEGLTERNANQIAAALNTCNFIVKTIEDQTRRPAYLGDRRKWDARRLEAIRLAAVTGADE